MAETQMAVAYENALRRQVRGVFWNHIGYDMVSTGVPSR